MEESGGSERWDEIAADSNGRRERASGGSAVEARGGPGKLAGDLADLKGRSGATAEPRELAGEDDHTVELKNYPKALILKLTS